MQRLHQKQLPVCRHKTVCKAQKHYRTIHPPKRFARRPPSGLSVNNPQHTSNVFTLNGIVGVWTEISDHGSETIDLMLNALRHRGPLTRVESVEGRTHGVALGCLSHQGTSQQILRTRTTLVALNGSFYAESSAGSAKHLLGQLEKLKVRNALHEAVNEFGGFAGLVGKRDSFHAFRDVNGFTPLYYACSRNLTAFASERKALWRIGLMDVRPVPPGFALNLTRKKITQTSMARFRRPRERKMSFEQASTILRRLLSDAVRRITHRTERVCVAFSGGLDSALTAAMAKRAGIDVRGVSVGLVGSSEISSAEKYAHELGLDVTVQTFNSDSIEEYVRRVLWLIEDPNLMKLSVAIPLHWAAMVAARGGCRVMLCGQGSDELYGGYSKYATTLRLRGRKALSDQLYSSVIQSSSINYERDNQATSPFPVELRTPFTEPNLIKFSLTIPSEFKVKDGSDVTRKWILRDIARKVGVPEDIVLRRKKAIQHGTGVEKAILKLSKSRGLTPDEYLSKTFQEVRRLESMP
jgi:asparagine synthase (glutamine-hydrolysing)